MRRGVQDPGPRGEISLVETLLRDLGQRGVLLSSRRDGSRRGHGALGVRSHVPFLGGLCDFPKETLCHRERTG